VPHLVNPKPGLLKQIIGVRTALRLREEESMELWADPLDKLPGCAQIALLIAHHQPLDIAVHMHGFEGLPEFNHSSQRIQAFGSLPSGAFANPFANPFVNPFQFRIGLFDRERQKVTQG